MHYRVFFYFGASGAQISSAKAVETSLEDISEKLLERLVADGDYLGLIDGQDQVLQIAREAGDRYWVELPVDAARASYGCHLELAALEELMETLPERFERSLFPGLQYRPW